MKAMILAAGLGTRLRPHTTILPKPAIPFLNIPMIYYSLGLLKTLDLDQLVVNTHYLPEKIVSILESAPAVPPKLQFSRETVQLLGSGGGIGFARAFLEGDDCFCVMNGDEILFPSQSNIPEKVVQAHRTEKATATLLVMKHPNVGSQFGGVWVNKLGEVEGFGKTAPRGGLTGYHFTGFQVFSDRIFHYIPKGASNIFYDCLTQAIRKGERVRVVEDSCKWFEIGNTTDFLAATAECLGAMVNRLESPWLRHVFLTFWPRFSERRSLWEGCECHHQVEDLSQGPVLMGNGCFVDKSVHITGFAVIGDNARIEAGSRLHNCVIGPSAHINNGAQVENDLRLTP